MCARVIRVQRSAADITGRHFNVYDAYTGGVHEGCHWLKTVASLSFGMFNRSEGLLNRESSWKDQINDRKHILMQLLC